MALNLGRIIIIIIIISIIIIIIIIYIHHLLLRHLIGLLSAKSLQLSLVVRLNYGIVDVYNVGSF